MVVCWLIVYKKLVVLVGCMWVDSLQEAGCSGRLYHVCWLIVYKRLMVLVNCMLGSLQKSLWFWLVVWLWVVYKNLMVLVGCMVVGSLQEAGGSGWLYGG